MLIRSIVMYVNSSSRWSEINNHARSLVFLYKAVYRLTVLDSINVYAVFCRGEGGNDAKTIRANRTKWYVHNHVMLYILYECHKKIALNTQQQHHQPVLTENLQVHAHEYYNPRSFGAPRATFWRNYDSIYDSITTRAGFLWKIIVHCKSWYLFKYVCRCTSSYVRFLFTRQQIFLEQK